MNQTTKYYYQHLTTNQKVGIRDTQATDETLSKENEERMKRTHVIIQKDNNEHLMMVKDMRSISEYAIVELLQHVHSRSCHFSYICSICKVGNVGKVDLRFGTIQFYLQFGLFNGVVAKINALL